MSEAWFTVWTCEERSGVHWQFRHFRVMCMAPQRVSTGQRADVDHRPPVSAYRPVRHVLEHLQRRSSRSWWVGPSNGKWSACGVLDRRARRTGRAHRIWAVAVLARHPIGVGRATLRPPRRFHGIHGDLQSALRRNSRPSQDAAWKFRFHTRVSGSAVILSASGYSRCPGYTTHR